MVRVSPSRRALLALPLKRRFSRVPSCRSGILAYLMLGRECDDVYIRLKCGRIYYDVKARSILL